jgi:UDP-N-acetylmuramoylalanine--D-glutamate ligase
MKTSLKEPVAILGFGVEGHAAFDFLKSQTISDITICDENESIEIPENVKNQLGSKAFENLKSFRTIVRSPGVHYNLPGILEAKDASCLVTSLTELTLETAADRITAITGSNGKTTTVGLLEEILKTHYKSEIIVGGNDRKPVLTDAIEKSWPILIEVSSFQFADLKISPHISVILNITPNHLDWHENEADYIHAKSNLIAHQTPNDWAVLNAGDENSAKLAEKAPSQIFWLNKKEGKAWATWQQDKLVAQFGHEELEVLKKEDLFVKTHPDNILAAVAVSLLHQASPTLIKSELGKFKGAEHRLEFVREINGIKFYNDSACTTPESAIVATQQFPKGTMIMLLGGSSKRSYFSFLAHHISQTKTRAYLFGTEGERIAEALKNEGADDLILHMDTTRDFEKIIGDALNLAKPGDNIVLSPACASFDMFKNAKHRGKRFKEIVENL